MTNAELAVLSLLVEQPRHGYEIERVIEERGMRDWTEIGFSSIYYVLGKLEKRGSCALERGPRGPRSVAQGLRADRRRVRGMRTGHGRGALDAARPQPVPARALQPRRHACRGRARRPARVSERARRAARARPSARAGVRRRPAVGRGPLRLQHPHARGGTRVGLGARRTQGTRPEEVEEDVTPQAEDRSGDRGDARQDHGRRANDGRPERSGRDRLQGAVRRRLHAQVRPEEAGRRLQDGAAAGALVRRPRTGRRCRASSGRPRGRSRSRTARPSCRRRCPTAPSRWSDGSTARSRRSSTSGNTQTEEPTIDAAARVHRGAGLRDRRPARGGVPLEARREGPEDHDPLPGTQALTRRATWPTRAVCRRCTASTSPSVRRSLASSTSSRSRWRATPRRARGGRTTPRS